MNQLKNQSIEDVFLVCTKDAFPAEKDYVSLYKLTKEYMDAHIHEEIKAVANSYLDGEYLNDHGIYHIKEVVNRASFLALSLRAELTPYEMFFLLMAIQMHDAGHIIKGRKEHAETARELINKILSNTDHVGGFDFTEKNYISKLVCAHSGKDDPIGKLQQEVSLFQERIRLRLLASILRFADELAEDCLRASAFLIDTNHEVVNEKSKIFHKYSKALKSCVIRTDSHEIELVFCLLKSDVLSPIVVTEGESYLLDEIYRRTMKTFTEMLYYNRFVPEEIRMERISVKIQFLDESSSGELCPDLSYRLEETGYPTLNFTSVFEIDQSLLDNGQKKDGEYFRNKIEVNSI